MATPRFAWGIDIGNRALKAVRLSPGPEGLKIDDFDVVEHEQVLSNAGDNRETLLQSALANFIQRHDLKGVPVAIGVSGQSSFARFIKLPPVEPKKIPEIVRFEAIQQIPFPLDEVEWSYQLFQDPNSPDVEVGIFAMRKELVNQHIKFFTDMGLNVQIVQMNPLAVYNAMYYDQRIKGTTMIIDLGAENTDLIIAEGETIWLRSIPIGGNNFTETLVKAFKLKFPKAEELKRNAATSKYGRQILQAMKPVFNDLVSEIQRSIGFYASTHREAKISRVLALGGTFRLPGLQKYVQQNLQVEVHRIDRLGAGAPSDARGATIFNENILSSVSAYGLAIQALDAGKINSSLLPMKIRREKRWQEKTKWFAAAAAVFIAAPLVGYASIGWGRSNLESTKLVEKQNTDILGDGTTGDSNWDQNVENAGAPDRTRIANIQSLALGRDTQPTLISDIVSCLPKPDPVLLTNDKNKMPDRKQRKIIRIDKIAMDYHDDMAQFVNMNEEALRGVSVAGIGVATPDSSGTPGRGGAAAAGIRDPRMALRMRGRTAVAPTPQATPEGEAAAGPKQRGFVIEVLCTTPNAEGASYVLSTFVARLKTLTSGNPQVSYAIDKVVEPSFMKLGSSDQSGQSGQPTGFSGRTSSGLGLRGRAMGGRGNYGGGGFNPGAAAATTTPAEPEFNPMQDPATGEDMSDDTQVTVRLTVLLDPPPKQPAAAPVAQANP